MNERIKELAEQAGGVWLEDWECFRSGTLNLTRFAELVRQDEREANAKLQESISTNDHLCAMLRQVHDVLACTALPMKRKWVGLTDEQLSETYNELYTQYTRGDVNIADFILIARTIELQLKEKNGG